jgi:hypothetical protein
MRHPSGSMSHKQTNRTSARCYSCFALPFWPFITDRIHTARQDPCNGKLSALLLRQTSRFQPSEVFDSRFGVVFRGVAVDGHDGIIA